MNDDERTKRSMARRREVLGAAYVDAAQARRNPFNDAFQDFLTRTAWGDIWQRPGLDTDTRRLVTLALMVALNRADEFKLHARAALAEGGMSRDTLKELLLHCAIYCGLPAANEAFRHAQHVIDELDAKRASDTT